MASTILEFEAPSGLTLTADVVALDDTLVLNDAAATERTNSKGDYRITHAGTEIGIHRIVYSAGGSVIGRQWVDIEADDTNVYRGVDNYQTLVNLIRKGTSYRWTNDGTGSGFDHVTVDDIP